ncbi:sugar-binding domain-containing protein [Marispirochaeta sp.]|uniref:glycoside hydrolase family 2 protein n=1 Tax=Marispirochaeta sp. TaxID=2038653 RepID=UPI0029C6BB54|nr:sugar-binding domain-containing protein [Marispirochaeta sp.]
MKHGYGRKITELNGTWLYTLENKADSGRVNFPKPEHDRSAWQKMNIPNNWYLTEVGDYDGAVWFYRSFDLSEEMKGRKVSLQFVAVDYIAQVWLNGEYLGSHEGYFSPFEFDISDTVLASSNCLVVRVDSPRDPTEYILVDDPNNLSTPMSRPYKKHWAKDLSIVKGHLIDAMHRPGAMTKFRQDGNTGGIWQPVRLIARGETQISYAKVYSKIVERNFVPDGSALVSIDLEITNTSREIIQAEAELLVEAENFNSDEQITRSCSIELQPGMTIRKLVVTIPEVRLWSTWDTGKPNLYKATIRLKQKDLIDDHREIIFGVKNIQHDDATGQWTLNGSKLFLRGMRYYSSMYLSEISSIRMEKDLMEMLEMNINSIRIGSHVELDDFYTLCDRMGFLVWQNFPLHYCYSDSDELIERAGIMMRDMVRMLHNHACIGMWSVFKEPQIYGLPNMPNNYGRLCEILYETGKTVDPIRWMHKGDYQEGVQNLMTGCCQPGDLDMKRIRIEPNIVEFGSHALPSRKSLEKIIPKKDLWPPNWDVWEYYCFFYDLQVRHTRLDLSLDSLDKLIEQSQKIEARTIKEQIEFLRQRKYAPVGSMYLYYWNDAAPVIGSGIVDYFGEKLPAYYSMKQVYTPVLASLEWNKDPYIIGYDKFWKPGDLFVGKIWINNDFQRELPVTLNWALRHMDSTSTEMERALPLTLAKDSAKVVETIHWQVPQRAHGSYTVQMLVTDENGNTLSENDFLFIIA